MSYTEIEIEAAVRALVSDEFGRSETSAGTLDGERDYRALRDRALCVFLLNPDAAYYVFGLAVARFRERLELVRNQGEALRRLARSLGTRVEGLCETSGLAGAHAALGRVEGASGALGGAPSRGALRQFERHVDRFLGETARRLGTQGAPMLAEEARASLADAVAEFRAARDDVTERAGWLSHSLAEYRALELPGELSDRVMTRARTVLKEWSDRLRKLDERERLGLVREVTLDVIAAKVVIQRFASGFTAHDEVRGTATLVVDAEHPGEPAVLRAQRPAPYPITADSELALETQAGIYRYHLPPSYVAEQISASGPFEVTTESDSARVELLSGSGQVLHQVDVSWPVGSAVTAEELAAAFTVASSSTLLKAEPAFSTLRFSGSAALEALSTGGVELRSNNPMTDWQTLGVIVGDKLVVGGANTGNVYRVTRVDSEVVTAESVSARSSTTEDGIDAQIGAFDRALRITIEEGRSEQAARERWAIRLAADSGEHVASAQALGFVAGLAIESAPVSAQALKKALNASRASEGPGARPLEARVVFVPSGAGKGRADAANPARITALRDSARAVVTTQTSELVVPTELIAAVGDRVVIVGASDPELLGITGAVSERDGAAMKVSWAATVAAGTMTIEVRPAVEPASALRITDGVNEGVFHVAASVAASSEWTTHEPLVRPIGLGGLVETFSLEWGDEYVEWVDAVVSDPSHIAASPSGNAFALFFSSAAIAYGTTRTFRSPLTSRIEPGDWIRVSQGNADQTARVVAVSRNIVTLDTSLAQEPSAFNFGSATESPRMVHEPVGSTGNGRIVDALIAFVKIRVSSRSWTVELERRLYQASREPSSRNIAAVTEHLEEWIAACGGLDAALASYAPRRVEDVDVLLSAYRERGKARASDLLLAGRFAAFFGADALSASYAGALAKASRIVARNAPTRQHDKESALGAPELLQTEETEDWDVEQSLRDRVAAPAE